MQRLSTAYNKTTIEFKGLNRKLPPREQKARQYIIDSFTGKMPTLIRFALENKSIVKLASYLLKHTTGSKHTLYQYVFGIYRFCKWINKIPENQDPENGYTEPEEPEKPEEPEIPEELELETPMPEEPEIPEELELEPEGPVVLYAKNAGLLNELIDCFRVIENYTTFDSPEKLAIVELAKLGELANTPYIISVVNSVLEDEEIDYFELWFTICDLDGDYIENEVELEIYGTNIEKIDSDGGGVDDFNEIYSYSHYGMDPNNPQDDVEFINRIPNVVALNWDEQNIPNKYSRGYNGYAEVCLRDPYVQWLAENAEIRWDGDPNMDINGHFYVNEEPAWNGPPPEDDDPLPTGYGYPAYYFTHGRLGSCSASSVVNNILLQLKGIKAQIVVGEPTMSGTRDHAWNEVYINGEVYVLNFNYLYLREDFYAINQWVNFKLGFDEHDYNPDWYQK